MNQLRCARSLSSLALFSVMTLGTAACTDDPGEDPPVVTCDAETYFPDEDGDGFGDASRASCEPVEGYIAQGGDCDDGDRALNPGSTEVCDTIDNNCDGLVDDEDPLLDRGTGTTYYADEDGDGHGGTGTVRRACAAPAGFVESATDCDDDLATVHPGATEICDQLDNDCDQLVDVDDPTLDPTSAMSYYRDADGDTFGAGPAMLSCSAPVGFVLASNDCDDADSTAKPGGIEICDGADNDCDGGIDGTAAAPNGCAALVGSYAGSYGHSAQEKLGTTVINSMVCSGTGSGSLLLTRKPALQGTFSCIYNGGLVAFDQQQTVSLRANVALDGTVTGTIEHVYDTFDNLRRTYNVTGTQTATNLTLTGTGSFFPHPMSAVAWQVAFDFATTR